MQCWHHIGGGSNAIGTFYHFIEDEGVRLIGCEAAGRGVNTAETAATIATGRPGIFHGMRSYFCQDEYGQIAPVYSISADSIIQVSGRSMHTCTIPGVLNMCR